MDFLLRFGRVSGIAAGALIAVPGTIEAFTGETTLTSVLIAVSPTFAFPLLTALYLTQRHRAGKLGPAGYAANVIGLGLFGGAAFALNLVVFFTGGTPPTQTRIALLCSVAVFCAGVLLFGASLVKARVLPLVPSIAYGPAFFALAFASRLPDSPLTSGLHLLAGGAVCWLAVALGNRAGSAAPAS
ncbi:hypothetical protein [Longispora albida]|uniref:hypothetical protein n=1 Tax=Longispora albida TaxID=203523 RepID=UPI00036FA41A|nr:hypothetical protein [Longispora albida]